ncbi:MAG: hypothetical protein GY711_06360, partial [bacterium]|nr:hypothetical protein [bacterium]
MRVPSVLRRLCFLATFGPALLTLHAPGQELVAGGQTQSAPVSAATPTVTFVNPTTIACGDRTWDGRHVIVDACEVTIDCNHRFESLQVRNGGIVTHSAKVEEGLVLSIARDVLVDVGSKIDVSGKGYDVSGGPGVGDVDPSLNGSGGSHGGSGHSSASGLAEVNLTYGSVREPASLGSRGGGVAGGAGGGRLRLVVRGTLTVEGAIHADGAAGSGDSGGGSGGSIWITTRTLAGDGLVAADGGVRHSSGGCGGGGRVAVYFDEQLVPPATLRACGGPSGAGRNGGAGSVFTKRTADPLAKLVYDNCGANGARSILWDADEFGPGSPLAADLFVQG